MNPYGEPYGPNAGGSPHYEQAAAWPVRPGEYDAPPAYGPPGPGGPYTGPPLFAPRRTNRLAIVSLVTGLVGLAVFAVPLGIAALVQAGRRGEKGKGLAVTGLVFAVAWTGAAVAAYMAFVSPLLSVKRDAAGHIVHGGELPAGDLRIGDCFTGLHGDETTMVTVTLCTDRHDAEVIAKITLPDQPSYPGDKWVTATSGRMCGARYGVLAKSRYRESLQSYFLKPKHKAWDSGERKVTCVLRDTEGTLLTSPLMDTLEPGLKLYKELAVRDCIKDVSSDNGVISTTSCDRPHDYQVYGKVSVPRLLPKRTSKAYPGNETIAKPVARYCRQRGTAVFAAHPPNFPIQGGYLYPREQQWDGGTKVAFCIVKRTTGSLNRSVVPK